MRRTAQDAAIAAGDATLRRICRSAAERKSQTLLNTEPSRRSLHAAMFLKEFAGGLPGHTWMSPERRGRTKNARRGCERGERRRGPHPRGTRLHQRDMEMNIQQNPIIVHVIQPPVDRRRVGDVLVGAIGLTGWLVLVAIRWGERSAAVLIASN